VQTGIRNCNHGDISLPAIAGRRTGRKCPVSVAVHGSGALILVLLPLVVLIGCLAAEDALLSQGNDLCNLEAYEAASLLFTRYIQFHPKAPEGYFFRGRAYQDMGDLKAAERDFEAAILLNADNTSYRWARYEILRLRYKNLETSAALPLERPAWETLKSALATLMMKDLDGILRLDPHDVAARMEYASLLSLRGSTQEAVFQLDRAVLELPFDPGVRNERGRMLHEVGRYADAITDYDMALRYCDSCTLVKYNRALSLRKCGKMEEAIAAFQEVVMEDSLDGGAWFNLGELQHLLGRSQAGCLSLQKSMSLGIPEARDLYEKKCR